MEKHLKQGNYQLDEAEFYQQYFLSRGRYPSDEIVLLYSSVVDMAHTAYIQGVKGEPFKLPFPIKKT
jgi:hypothetical protein